MNPLSSVFPAQQANLSLFLIPPYSFLTGAVVEGLERRTLKPRGRGFESRSLQFSWWYQGGDFSKSPRLTYVNLLVPDPPSCVYACKNTKYAR